MCSHVTHASFGPPESTTLTASRSVEPFLHCTRQCHRNTSFPLKIVPSHGDLHPHLIYAFLGLLESIAQTASRSVQPRLQGSLLWQTKSGARIYERSTAIRPRITSGQSNLKRGRIAAAHGRFSGIRQMALVCSHLIHASVGPPKSSTQNRIAAKI